MLYGLDKAKTEIRKKDYAVLVEGQIDLVLSHQVGVENSVASSGTAFTRAHLERLKHLSSRIILAFDGDSAGEKAAEKATELALSLGLEVKVADLPAGLDPAEVARKNPEAWKNILRQSLPAVEFFFNRIKEQEPRKLGKQVEKKILPMIKLIGSSIEQSHFISMIAKRTGIKEEMLWDDLRKVKTNPIASFPEEDNTGEEKASPKTRQEIIRERLSELQLWRKEFLDKTPETTAWKIEEAELKANLAHELLREKLLNLALALSSAEISKDYKKAKALTARINSLHKEMRALEEKKKML